MEFPDKSGAQPPPPPKKNIPVVASGKEVKRPATKRFLAMAFAESPKTLGSRIARDVVVPRIKAGFEEAANAFLAGMLWGDSSNRPMSGIVRGTVLRGGATNYQAMSLSPGAQARQMTQPQSIQYTDIVYPTRQEAERVLAIMIDLLNQYRVVAVGDLKEASNVTSSLISDNSYGWTSFEGVRITAVHGGFALELPRPQLIN